MWKSVLLAVAGLGTGFAIAAWLAPSADLEGPGTSRGPPTPASAPGPDRVGRLEAALAAETAARSALESRVATLTQQLQALTADIPQNTPKDDDNAAAQDRPPRARVFPAFGGNREQGQQRERDALLAAGFAPDRVDWIARRESELRMQTLQARYDAARAGKPFDPAVDGPDSTLRSELGDADYERYLQALNRPTAVAVRDVLASSPAEQAGLKPGDEVVAYDGARVFDMRELNALTLKGTADQPVVVDVLRDGQRVQVVVPRGPVGILGGGRFGPRP